MREVETIDRCVHNECLGIDLIELFTCKLWRFMETAQLTSHDMGNAIPVAFTSEALSVVKQTMKEEGLEKQGLRVAVKGGGCSGLQYALDFCENSRVGDFVFDLDGLKVFIDMASAQYLKGTEIDYVTGLNGSGFKFNNPNARRTCGCGHSMG